MRERYAQTVLAFRITYVIHKTTYVPLQFHQEIEYFSNLAMILINNNTTNIFVYVARHGIARSLNLHAETLANLQKISLN